MPRRIRPLASWTLRARLAVSLVAVLAVVSLVIGGVTVVALRSYLVHQLDDRLGAASRRGAGFEGRGNFGGGTAPGNTPTPGSLPPQLFAIGQGEGTFAAQISADDQTVNAGRITASGQRVAFTPTDATLRTLAKLPADGRPRTVSLPGLGAYRIAAVSDPVRGGTLVTGLPLAPVSTTVYRLALIISVVTLVGAIAAAFIILWIVRLNLRPLRRVTAAATEVTELRLDQGEVAVPVRVGAADTDPHTEVGQVGSALNHLIGHVESALAARQASEMRVRHFVADASHELRTPLAAIRGYAELTRPHRSEAPPAMAHAMERVESAAERMSRLVEDLLLLARLDTGRAVETETVDLSDVVIGAVSDAHAAAPGHRWQLDLPDEPVEVAGDRLQLHQVVANLLSNARTHTPPGTIVQVGLRQRPAPDSGAEVTVTDNGPGIPESLRPNVFERFARGDSSRSREAGSTGLGLAIVSSVVAAHHGRVGLTSQPGQTQFVVWLPPQQPARAVTADA